MFYYSKKPNLVISAVGDESLHEYWKPDNDSNYDLFLIYYGDKTDKSYNLSKKGTKFHLIADIFNYDDLFKYEYIWMPDDDVYLKNKDISKLFNLAKTHDLWICQPSIMGWYGLEVTLHQRNSFMRFTNYVEIMCPCFSRDSLFKCVDTFKTNKSGWGIDALWNIRLGRPTSKLAIIDDIIAIHTRPVGGGDIYKNQTNNSIAEALEEAKDLHKKYNLDEENYEDMKKGKVTNVESFDKLYFNTVEYGRIYKSTEAGVDVSARIWPKCDYMSGLCQHIRDSVNN